MLKYKLLNLGLFITSLFGYIEWGDNSMLLLNGEIDILSQFFNNSGSFLHPFILLPFIGQIFLLITLFLKKQNKTLTILGMGGIGILILLILLIGLLNLNLKMIFSTMPFLITVFLILSNFDYFKKKKVKQ